MKFTYDFYLSDEQVKKLKRIQQGLINYSVQSGAFTYSKAKEIFTIEETFKSVMLVGEKWRVDDALSQMLGLYEEFIGKESEV